MSANSKDNFKAHILKADRVELSEVVPLDTPFTVLIESSRLCNFKCKFCPQNWKDQFELYDENLITSETINLVTEQLAKFPRKIKKIYMHGTGEALINKELPNHIRTIKESGVCESIDLTSNGLLLTENLGKELVQAGLDHLHISLEAMSNTKYKEVIDLSGNTNYYEVVTENIKKFASIKNRCRLSVKVAESSVKEEIEKKEFIETFKDVADDIYIENIYPIWPEYEFSDEYKTKDSDLGQYGAPLLEKEVCPQIFTTLAIKADGRVSPCSMDWSNKIVLGNLKETSLKEMWDGEMLAELRKKHLKEGRKKCELCRTCGLPKYSCVDNLDAARQQIMERMTK